MQQPVPIVPAVQPLRSVQNVQSRSSVQRLKVENLFNVCARPTPLPSAHRQWVEGALEGELMRDDRCSEAIAVGSGTFVEKVKSELGVRATHREIVEVDRTYGLREPSEAYGSEFASENHANVGKQDPM